MPEITQDDVRRYLATGDQVTMLLDMIAQTTKTDKDDLWVNILRIGISQVRMLNSQPYVAMMLDIVVHLITGTSHEAQEKVKKVATLLVAARDAGEI